MNSVQRAKKGAACKECARRKRKCIHTAITLHRTPAPAVQAPSPFCYVSAGGNTQLGYRFVDTIRSLRLDHLWLSMVPIRVGDNETVDSAINALIRNQDLVEAGERSSNTTGLRNYVKAVERLRHDMARPEYCVSDEALLTVALLCVCEALMKSEMFMCFSHWCGMRAILLSRPQSYPASELTRAILYHIRNQTFHIPVAMGTTSPFDDPRWYTLQPAGQHKLPPEIAALKRCSNELLIRLPRLIVLVRKLRQAVTMPVKEQAIRLAHELAMLQDKEAESKLLHGVRVVKTDDEEQRTLVPFSFHFGGLGQMETAVVYWKYLLLLFNLILKLKELFPESTFDVESVKNEMLRMGSNVTMSWQYAKTRNQRAHSKGHVAMPTALLTLYCIYKHIDEFRGVPVERWREWTLDRQNEVNAVWSIVGTRKDMDDCCDLFTGGPLKGLFVAAYSDVPFWVRYQYPHDEET